MHGRKVHTCANSNLIIDLIKESLAIPDVLKAVRVRRSDGNRTRTQVAQHLPVHARERGIRARSAHATHGSINKGIIW